MAEGGGDDADNLWFIGAGGDAAKMDPVRVLAVLPEVKIHGVDGVVHGGMFAGVGRGPPKAAVIFIGSLEDAGGYSCGVDGSH